MACFWFGVLRCVCSSIGMCIIACPILSSTEVSNFWSKLLKRCNVWPSFAQVSIANSSLFAFAFPVPWELSSLSIWLKWLLKMAFTRLTFRPAREIVNVIDISRAPRQEEVWEAGSHENLETPQFREPVQIYVVRSCQNILLPNKAINSGLPMCVTPNVTFGSSGWVV